MKATVLFRFFVCSALGFCLLGCLSGCQETDNFGVFPDQPELGTPAPGDSPEYAALIAPLVKCMNLPRPADAYTYPVYPGMAAWATLASSQERENACQIPLGVIRAQSTAALIWDLWEYPFFAEPLVASSSTCSAQAVANSAALQALNAYRELLERKDNTTCLVTCYRAMDALSDPLFHTLAFEAFLTSDGLLPQLTIAERKELILAAREKDKLRQTDPNRSSAFRAVSWYFIGKLLQTAPYAPFTAEIAANETLGRFLATSSLAEATPAILETIGKYADSFVREH